MNRKPKASLSFTRFTVPQKIAFGGIVIKGLTDYAGLFTNPDVPVSDLETINEELKHHSVGANQGIHAEVQAMNKTEKTWNDAFRTDANYVTNIAKGSAEKVLKSGFHCTKTETEIPVTPGEVKNLKVTPGSTGKIDVTINKLKGARVYLYLISQSEEGVSVTRIGKQLVVKGFNGWFMQQMSSRCKVSFDGLPSGELVHIQVIGVNSAGLGIIMPPMKITVW